MGALTPVVSAEPEAAIPHLIICEIKGARHFVWLDTIKADGSAIYITPSGSFVKLSKDGVMVRPGAAKGNCVGKTVEELIASGQALFIGE